MEEEDRFCVSGGLLGIVAGVLQRNGNPSEEDVKNAVNQNRLSKLSVLARTELEMARFITLSLIKKFLLWRSLSSVF